MVTVAVAVTIVVTGGPVTVVVVSPLAWSTALRLAQGDRRRLQVVSVSAMIVRNRLGVAAREST